MAPNFSGASDLLKQRKLEQSEEGHRMSEDKFQKVFRSSRSFSITTVNEGRFLH